MPNFYDIYSIIPPRQEGGKSNWIRIGVAFLNRDGQSFAIKLDALPLPRNGEAAELYMRLHEEREYQQATGRAQRPARRTEPRPARGATDPEYSTPPDGNEFGGPGDFNPPDKNGGREGGAW